MNVIEKILAKASNNKEVHPGDVVVANVDLMVMHDLSSNFVMKVFENEMENAKIADPSRITFAFDHNFAPATQQAAEALAAVRKFAAKHGIRNVFDCGCGSVHHAIIESRLWKPGQIIIGCDSHTPIYGALGLFATGVGNNSMAALGFQHHLGWFRVPETIQVFFHGKDRPGRNSERHFAVSRWPSRRRRRGLQSHRVRRSIHGVPADRGSDALPSHVD